LLASPDGSDWYKRPATGGFYVQAFDGAVTLTVAGYNYDIDWTPMSAGLTPAGMAASFAAPLPQIADIGSSREDFSVGPTADLGSTLELSFAAADHIGDDQLHLQAFMVCQRRIECSNIGINLLSNFIGAATVVPKCHIFKSLQ